MNKNKIILFLTFLLIFPLGLVTAAPKEQIVAKVDGFKITKKLLEETYKQNLLFVSDKLVTKKRILNDLINRRLGIKRAKKNKLQDNTIVKNKMEDILYHAQISKDLEPQLKTIVVKDNDVKTYYKSHPEYKTAHILFRMRANPVETEKKAAIAQALKVYNALKLNPQHFPELANKFSQSSTAPNGGNMGFQPAIRLAPEFWKAIKGKPVNFISSPIRTQFGYHIVKILGEKKYKDINIPLYKKIVYDQKRDAILEKYFVKLKKGAVITINKELLK